MAAKKKSPPEEVTQRDRIDERKEAKAKAQSNEDKMRKKERIKKLQVAADAMNIVQPPKEVSNDLIMECLRDEGFGDDYEEKDIIASKVKEDGLARVVMSDGEKIPIMHKDIKMPTEFIALSSVPTHSDTPNS